MAAEWLLRGKPSLLGVVSGAVSGLVAITPAAGFAGPMGAIALGLVTGAACLWGVTGLKHMLGYDDSLDVFGVHGIGGIIGAIGTGIVVNPALGGSGVFDYATGTVAAYSTAQIFSQLWGVAVAIVWSGVVSLVILVLLKYTIGLRVTQDEEREGLDTVSHGERAYTM